MIKSHKVFIDMDDVLCRWSKQFWNVVHTERPDLIQLRNEIRDLEDHETLKNVEHYYRVPNKEFLNQEEFYEVHLKQCPMALISDEQLALWKQYKDKKDLLQSSVNSVVQSRFDNFWIDIEPDEHLSIFMDWVTSNLDEHPTILTAPLWTDTTKELKDQCFKQKLQWVHKHLNNWPISFVCERDKGKFANVHKESHSILIDDRYKNLHAWKNNGGISVFHNPWLTNPLLHTTRNLKQLKETL